MELDTRILLGAHAKIYHDLAKKYGVLPEDIKLLMNSFYGNYGIRH